MAKTTMIDNLMKQSGSFRENEVVDERLMDSGELEKERGITILAKARINKLARFKSKYYRYTWTQRFRCRSGACIKYGRWRITSN